MANFKDYGYLIVRASKDLRDAHKATSEKLMIAKLESAIMDCEVALRELRSNIQEPNISHKTYQGTVNGTPTGKDRSTISEAYNDANLRSTEGDSLAVIDSETMTIVQPAVIKH